jgi:hypothetical protein
MLKAFPARKNNSGLLLSGSGENVTKPLRQLISSSVLGGAFFSAQYSISLATFRETELSKKKSFRETELGLRDT